MAASVHPIRVWRTSQKPKVTLEKLAKRLRTSEANLSRIETHKQPVTDDLLRLVVAATGVPARELRPDLAELFEVPGARAKKRERKAA